MGFKIWGVEKKWFLEYSGFWPEYLPLMRGGTFWDVLVLSQWQGTC